MNQSAVIRSVYPRAVVTVVAFVLVAFVLGASLARVVTQLVPSVPVGACVVPPAADVPLYSGGYTGNEASARLNARITYPVERLRYAPSVHGVVRRRHVEAL